MSIQLSILDALPQTQCTRCGFPDCAAYALAIELKQTDINQCPPGGQQGVQRLSTLTGLPASPLNPLNGQEGPRHVAWIDETWCIGCTLCIDVCPTDAIIGSNKQMHTVIEDVCTGCELCIPACPVDCLHLENTSGKATGWNAWSQTLANQARLRYENKLSRRLQKSQKTLAQSSPESNTKQSTVQAAIARANQLRLQPEKA